MADEIVFRPAVELARAIRARELSACEVLQAHLAQIERVNPSVNAIVTLVADRAIEEARRADEQLASGEAVGRLHGLPMVHKDTHATGGVRTTQGSPLFADFVPAEDELVVARVRDAGAVRMGKTNVPEFAAGSHTFNRIFGLTRNPYDLSRSAGGSSGGSAAALACGMTPLADGADMGGSLRNPASFCNVVGFRPTPGRVPTWPKVAAWSTLTQQGPMARTVADLSLLLSVMAGPDDRSPVSLDEPGSSFGQDLDIDMRGLRLAWSPDLGGLLPVEKEVVDVLTSQMAVFEELGAVVEPACIDFDGADYAFRTLRAWQFDMALGALRDQYPEQIKQTVVWNIDEGRRLTGQDIARAEQIHADLFHKARSFFSQYDALLLPVSQVLPFDVDIEYPTDIQGTPQQTYLDWMMSAYFVTTTCCPALSVPAGFSGDGLPVGLQVVGPFRRDLKVLQIGNAFEKATQHWRRRPPVVRVDREAGSIGS